MSKTNVILMGPIGTGKTTSLKTIVRAERRLAVLATEPGIENILEHSDQCHWCYIPPATEDWSAFHRGLVQVGSLTTEALMGLKSADKRAYQQMIQVSLACTNFRCDICHKELGPVDAFPPDVVFAIDGLSGLSKMSMDLVIGSKPVASIAEWGLAMGNLERFLTRCCADTKCSFVLISHVEREYDEVSGGTKIMVSTLGRKLAPRIPRFFDEVLLCRRDRDKFYWSSIDNSADLKVRRLPFSDSITPDFAPLLATRAGEE
jgi:hypothetical protein